MISWNTKHPLAMKAIERMAASEKYTARQLKALSNWQMVASSAMYVSVIAFLIATAAAEKQISLGVIVVLLLICILSIFFFFQGLCDCEAAHLKIRQEQGTEQMSLSQRKRNPISKPRRLIRPKK